uniref:Retrovirus-related Pol polyprotein from transposon TNT 1-94 n=1 Tax=Tanacetum cinerariifolium TaxID=118510 RepID=A0A699GX49_TANCI|nr:retrovirus-related Pol polyprotein from transposon TNT 1-94 [Tanacetum cinerariifolium]
MHNGDHVSYDTRPNGDSLRKCILEGPYTPTTVVVLAIPATKNSPAVPEHMIVETLLNMSPENKAHFESEKEVIHLILTGIGDEIYSTVDACKTAHEMWEAIERLQQDPKEDSDREQAQRDKDMQRNLALIAKYFKKIYKPTNNNLRTSSNTKNKNLDTTPRYKKDNQARKFGNQRTMTIAGARENVGGQPKRVTDSAYHKEKMLLCKQAEQELEAHYSYMAKIQEVPIADLGTDSEPLEHVQYDAEYNVFANEIQHSEQSKSIRSTCVEETGDSNVILDSPNMCDNDIQNEQNPVDCDDKRVALANLIANLKLDVDENKKIQKQLKKANTTLAQKLKECKSILAETSRTLGESNSILDSCLVALQNKQTEFEKYKACNDRTVDYDKLEPPKGPTFNGRPTFANPMYLKKDQSEIPCLYAIPYDQSDPANRLFPDKEETLTLENAHTELQCLYLHKVKECHCLAQKLSKQTESVSKEVYTELLRSFAKLEKHSISLELSLQQYKEQLENDTVCKEKASNVFRKEREHYFEIQDLKAQLQDKNIAISELKKLKEKCKGKSVETKFDKPFVVRQPNAQRIPKPSVLGKPAPFQTLLRGKVFHKQCRPQLRSTQMKDKVVPNNSKVKNKKTKKEYHHRISSIYKKTMSVTACNDSLKSKTSNVNDVCATCRKCLVDSDHFGCVTKMLNDMNAKTKKPNVVPISTRKPKGHANKSVATPPKKTVTSKSTTQKSKSFYRMLYEKTSTVRFGNDLFAPILGYGDLVQGNITINRVYYIEGLNHNLFSVGQLCDADLEVAFWKSTERLTNSSMVMASKTFLLNFDYINLLSKKDVMIGLPNLKYVKDQLCKAIGTACYTQNRSIIIPTHEKMAYHIINDRKPSIKHLYIFGCTCYLTKDGENLDKIKEKGYSCILVGYSTQSKGYRVYNKRTRLIVESIHLRFDEIKEMNGTFVVNDTSGLVRQ